MLLSSLALFLSNCDGEDGIDGIDATIDGTDGVNGTNGEDGEDGLGFDDLLQYGNIDITLQGTAIDDTPFTDQSSFKFTSIGSIQETSSVYHYEGDEELDEDPYTSFNVIRYVSSPAFIVSNALYFDLTVTNPEGGSPDYDIDMYLEGHVVYTTATKYFSFNEGYESDENMANLDISAYNFDEETGMLTMSFSFNVAPDDNNTNNDLAVSVDINVQVFERIETPETAIPL